MLEERFFSKCLEILKSTDSSPKKEAILNLIVNLAWKKENEESKARKYLIDLNLKEMLETMK